jgi:4-hydroxy-tetrahydrodipicolinate reductase
VAVADEPAPGKALAVEPLAAAEVVFEFSTAAAAEANVLALLRAGLAVVCGTTGWRPGEAVGAAVRESGAGLIIAPNFSVGINLFYRLTRRAAQLFGAAGLYEPFVWESHHRAKRDMPSGTAHRLAEILVEYDPRLERYHAGNADAPLPRNVLHVTSVRAGSEPGTHEVGFDGAHDRITLRHSARSRASFALGAVLAGEWIRGKPGQHDFDEILDDLLQDEPCVP